MATSTDTVQGYARAIVAVAETEGVLDRVGDELFAFARAVEGHAELRQRLTDPGIDLGARLELVTGVLGGKAHPQTVNAAMYVIQGGHARLLAEIADAVVAQVAQQRQQTVAEVRTAVPLDDEQQRRLGEAVAKAAGHKVDLRVVVDPKVVGGLAVRLGDTVIDNTIARRLAELRAQLTGV